MEVIRGIQTWFRAVAEGSLRALGRLFSGLFLRLDLLDRLVEEFTGTSRLVIIDEAQHLTERSFDTVRALTDKAGIGIVYAGTPDIRNRMVGRKQEELDQVYSRIAYNVELNNHYTIKEIATLFHEYDLDDEIIKACK